MAPAFMPPGFIEHLKDRFRDRVSKPILDEQQMEKINQVIGEALESGREITIVYWEPFGFRLTVARIITIKKQKLKCNIDGDQIIVKLDDVIDVF